MPKTYNLQDPADFVVARQEDIGRKWMVEVFDIDGNATMILDNVSEVRAKQTRDDVQAALKTWDGFR